MEISLDQVRAIIAIADTGSVVAASKKLHKTHTAILYQIKQLESQVGFSLLDRNRYKATLTPQGEEFLLEARRFLLAEDRLCEKAKQLESGGLGRWHLVYDAIFPSPELLEIVAKIQEQNSLSVRLLCDSLSGVEKTFWKEDSDFMLSLFSPVSRELVTFEVGTLKSFFVARKDHALANKSKRSGNSAVDLNKEHLIVVRGVEPQFALSTDQLNWGNQIVVNDFYSKKEAVLRGLGVGWIPEHLVQDEIEKKILCKLSGPFFGTREFKIFYSARKSLAEDPLLEKTLAFLKKSQWVR